MKLYVKSWRNGGNAYSTHEGMSQETVISLLTELGATSIEFITEQTYTDVLAEQALSRGN